MNKLKRTFLFLLILSLSSIKISKAQKFYSQAGVGIGMAYSSSANVFETNYNLLPNYKASACYTADWTRWRDEYRGILFGFGAQYLSFNQKFLGNFGDNAIPTDPTKPLLTAYESKIEVFQIPLRFGYFWSNRQDMRYYISVAALPTILVNYRYQSSLRNSQGMNYAHDVSLSNLSEPIYDFKLGFGQAKLGVVFPVSDNGFIDFNLSYMHSIGYIINKNAKQNSTIGDTISTNFWTTGGYADGADKSTYYTTEEHSYERPDVQKYMSSIGLNISFTWRLSEY